MGDPAGIGPEIVLKAVATSDVRAECRSIIVGDWLELSRQAALLGLSCKYEVLREPDAIWASSEDVIVFDTGSVDGPVAWGQISALAGRASISFVEAAVRLCMAGFVDAIATAPINKESLQLGGSPFPGHTEMLAALGGARSFLMSFFAGTLRVVLLTIHVSLAEAIRLITKERVAEVLIIADRELRRIGIEQPRIAVAGLNPHAGENGLFGCEEKTEIGPAIQECKRTGIDASGPYPADTLFLRAARGEFDLVVACYHDQGLIPVKSLAFGNSVGVTLGLPFVRTSVDHGTAFDIAGHGVADHHSMVDAIKLAAKLARDTASRQSA
jgi:4-hydroxythreonine-4-phosphate dehydrogenase